jgi:hypothetical protein
LQLLQQPSILQNLEICAKTVICDRWFSAIAAQAESLEHLTIGDCSAATPEGFLELQTLVGLQKLHLNGVAENASLQAAHIFSGMHQLKKLHLKGHLELTDTLCDSFGKMVELDDLALIGVTGFSETSCARMAAQLPQLQVIDISESDVEDQGLALLLQPLQQLRSVTLRSCIGITDACTCSLATLPKLESLVLARTTVTDTGVATLAPLNQLQYLSLCSTQVSDESVSIINASMQALTSLDLSCKRITDVGLRRLTNLSQLTSLNLSFSKVSDCGISALRRLPKLSNLSLRWTRISNNALAELTNTSKEPVSTTSTPASQSSSHSRALNGTAASSCTGLRRSRSSADALSPAQRRRGMQASWRNRLFRSGDLTQVLQRCRATMDFNSSLSTINSPLSTINSPSHESNLGTDEAAAVTLEPIDITTQLLDSSQLLDGAPCATMGTPCATNRVANVQEVSFEPLEVSRGALRQSRHSMIEKTSLELFRASMRADSGGGSLEPSSPPPMCENNTSLLELTRTPKPEDSGLLALTRSPPMCENNTSPLELTRTPKSEASSGLLALSRTPSMPEDNGLLALSRDPSMDSFPCPDMMPSMDSLHLDIDEPNWHNNDMWRTDEFDMDDVEDISHSISSMQLEPLVYRSIELDMDDVDDVVNHEHMDDDEPPALQDFRVLDLSVTDIADAGLSFLAAFSHIQSLNLFSTKITDNGLEHVAKMVGLIELDMCGTEVSDVGLSWLKPLDKLEVLKVCGNKRITDDGASWLMEALTTLTSLELRATSVTSECAQLVADTLAFRASLAMR